MRISKPVYFLIGVFVGLICIGGLIIFFFVLPPSNKPVAPVPAVSTIIPAQPLQLTATEAPVQEPTPTLPEGIPPDPGAQISIGMSVRIFGTEGQGLRLRRDAGKDGTPIFLGAENEIFEVVDGPESVDGFNWWYLKAPADSTRQGWAVSNYLLPLE